MCEVNPAGCVPAIISQMFGWLVLFMSILCYPEDGELTPAARQLRLIGLHKEKWKKDCFSIYGDCWQEAASSCVSPLQLL